MANPAAKHRLIAAGVDLPLEGAYLPFHAALLLRHLIVGVGAPVDGYRLRLLLVLDRFGDARPIRIMGMPAVVRVYVLRVRRLAVSADRTELLERIDI